MNRLLTMVLMVGLAAGSALAQGRPKADGRGAKASGQAVDELTQIENQWVAAVKAKDAAKLGEILAESWVGLGWDGRITDKATNLAELKSAGNSLGAFEMGPITVRRFGMTAVVTGSNTETSTEDGKDTSGKYLWTDVFVRQNGKWRAVASQSTKVPK
jgi:ketosteroid isomerase-like protein